MIHDLVLTNRFDKRGEDLLPSDQQIRSVCVFCASSNRVDATYLELSFRIGEMLAKHGLALVYGGAQCGMMGALADGALRAGGRVIGIMPEALVALEVAHSGLTEFILTRDMFERKAVMMERSDAFLTLPGGLGTLDELFEVLTHNNLGYHRKPSALFDHNEFYVPLLQWLKSAASGHFIGEHHLEVVRSVTECERFLSLT